MSVTLYKNQQIDYISDKMKVKRNLVESVLNSYIEYLNINIQEGNPVKFLGICYIKSVEESKSNIKKTLAYVSTEISRYISVSSISIYGILKAFEESIIQELLNGNSYCVLGLVKIQVKEVNGEPKVRLTKSQVYTGMNARVYPISSFKRKVLF